MGAPEERVVKAEPPESPAPKETVEALEWKRSEMEESSEGEEMGSRVLVAIVGDSSVPGGDRRNPSGSPLRQKKPRGPGPCSNSVPDGDGRNPSGPPLKQKKPRGQAHARIH